MDPLSVIAGVVSIASATCSASQALFQLVDDIKGGPEQVQAISRDAHAFYSVIFSLNLALQDRNIRLIISDDPSLVQMIENLSRPLSNCQAVLGQLMVKIEPRVKPTSDGRAFRINKLDFRWGFFAKNEVKELMTRLEATKSTLDNALGSITTFCSIRLLSQGKGSAAQELRRSSGSTDAGFALRRYLEESVSSGSIMYHSSSASIRSLQATEHDVETAAATTGSSSETRATRQPNAGEVEISRVVPNATSASTVLFEPPASANTLEQPSETPLPVASLDIGVGELGGKAVPAKLQAETLGATSAVHIPDESVKRGAKGWVQIGPEEPQGESSSIATAPTAVHLASRNGDTSPHINMYKLSENRLPNPIPPLPRSVAEYARSLEDHAAPPHSTAAILSPVSFNLLTEAFDPKRPVFEKESTILTEPLQLAVRSGDAIQTKTLLDAGADPNARDLETRRTALEVASLVVQYPVKVADILHQHGANINQADDEGWTLLHHATFRGRIREVRWLLRKGADIERISQGRRTIDGAILNWVTPLQIAASSKSSVSLSCLNELLQAGAGVETAANEGYAAINLAARTGSHRAITMLLAAGAKLDNSNNLTHDTPILEAIRHQQLDVVKYLLSLDAECIKHQIRFADTGFKLADKLNRVQVGPECPIWQKVLRAEIFKLVREAGLRPPRALPDFDFQDGSPVVRGNMVKGKAVKDHPLPLSTDSSRLSPSGGNGSNSISGGSVLTSFLDMDEQEKHGIFQDGDVSNEDIDQIVWESHLVMSSVKPEEVPNAHRRLSMRAYCAKILRETENLEENDQGLSGDVDELGWEPYSEILFDPPTAAVKSMQLLTDVHEPQGDTTSNDTNFQLSKANTTKESDRSIEVRPLNILPNEAEPEALEKDLPAKINTYLQDGQLFF